MSEVASRLGSTAPSEVSEVGEPVCRICWEPGEGVLKQLRSPRNGRPKARLLQAALLAAATSPALLPFCAPLQEGASPAPAPAPPAFTTTV